MTEPTTAPTHSTRHETAPVMVAVGTAGADSALGFAVAEAARLGCGVHLVHVLHLVPMSAEMVLVDTSDYERVAQDTLNAAMARARHLAPEGMPVSGEAVLGAVVSSLVQASRDARVVVLQRRHLSRLERVATRSVTNGVAARTDVPVVSVPEGWTGAGREGKPPRVVVGVDVPDRSAPVLAAAAEAARSRGARLDVLHTWYFPGAYDDIIMSRVEKDDWAERARKEIQAELDGLGDLFTGLEVRIGARHHLPADALVEASKDADLLVVGRHDPLIPFGSHLGPVSKALLRDAECPVLLAHPTTHHVGLRMP